MRQDDQAEQGLLGKADILGHALLLPAAVGVGVADGQRTAILDGKTLELTRSELEPILKESAPCLLRLANVDESVWELSVDLL